MKKNVIILLLIFCAGNLLQAQVKGSSAIQIEGGYTLNNGYNAGIGFEKILSRTTRFGFLASTLHLEKNALIKNEYYLAPYISLGQTISRLNFSVSMFPKIGYMDAKTNNPLLVVLDNKHFLFGLGVQPKVEINFFPLALNISYQYAYSFNSIFNSTNSINIGLKYYL